MLVPSFPTSTSFSTYWHINRYENKFFIEYNIHKFLNISTHLNDFSIENLTFTKFSLLDASKISCFWDVLSRDHIHAIVMVFSEIRVIIRPWSQDVISVVLKMGKKTIEDDSDGSKEMMILLMVVGGDGDEKESEWIITWSYSHTIDKVIIRIRVLELGK